MGFVAFCFLVWLMIKLSERPPLPEYEIDVLLTRLVRLELLVKDCDYDPELCEAITDTFKAVEQLAQRLRGNR